MKCDVLLIFYSVLCDPAAFLSYAGADQVVTGKSESTDTAGHNRARVSKAMKLDIIFISGFQFITHHFHQNLANPVGLFHQPCFTVLYFSTTSLQEGYCIRVLLTAPNSQWLAVTQCVGEQTAQLSVLM